MKILYDIDEKTHVDEFGVDHSNFSLRDELEYNYMRNMQRMNQVIREQASLHL